MAGLRGSESKQVKWVHYEIEIEDADKGAASDSLDDAGCDALLERLDDANLPGAILNGLEKALTEAGITGIKVRVLGDFENEEWQ